MISICHLFEGKVADHLKKHWGKYTIGAGALTLGPEAMSEIHKRAANKLADDALDSNNNENLLDRGSKLIKATKQVEKHLDWKNSPINIFSHLRGKVVDKEI